MAGAEGRSRLCDFIRAQRTRILEEWERAVRLLPCPQQLPESRLLNHLPMLLERVASVVEGVHTGERGSLEELPELHALQRLEVGADLEQVTSEYALLRACVLRLYRRDLAGGGERDVEGVLREVERFNQTFDEAVAVAISRYTRARERTLVALDRLSEPVPGTEALDSVLERLLGVVLETIEPVDCVTLLLREGDVLRVRASVGLENKGLTGFELRVGEGFAGKIAEERRPMESRSAATDPLVRSELLRELGRRALYGVPLSAGGELLGVAQMGSTTAFEFSREDKLLFRAMVDRATALLVQHQLAVREREARLEAQTRDRTEEELRRAAEFRERFLGIVSHDLRNPLNAILLSANALMCAEDLPPRHLKAVRRVVTSAERMARMIGELLDFTRGRLGGGIPVLPRPMNLRQLVRHVLEELEAGHPGRELWLEARGDFQGEWDPDRLAQVVGNLGKNALDYSPEETPVRFTLREEGGSVVLEVNNAGPPIPADRLATIFEPFRRLMKGSPHPASGLGLGLYIVEQIVQGHGGTCSVRSSGEEGTTFIVRLPRHTLHAQAEPPAGQA
ncbi:ATP-binding protein [Archangium sp.]|uniref:sensor histidine kinase n=1 Tax=Archangium sp. TaxID=1872627 RepID=UPI00389B20CE